MHDCVASLLDLLHSYRVIDRQFLGVILVVNMKYVRDVDVCRACMGVWMVRRLSNLSVGKR